MYNIGMTLGVLSLLGCVYFFVGLLIPRLPFVRTRGRAAAFLGGSLVAMVVFVSVAQEAMTPEQRQAQAQQEQQREQDRAKQASDDAVRRTAEAGPNGVKAAILDALGKPNRKGAPMPQVDFDSATGTLAVGWAINENLTRNMLKTGAQLDVVKVLKAAKESALPFTAVELTGSYSLVDAFGNGGERPVVVLKYTAPTIARINFDNFSHENAYLIADSKNIHPLFVPAAQ